MIQLELKFGLVRDFSQGTKAKQIINYHVQLMRRNLLSCGVSTIYNYLSIHFVIYPDIVSISESFKTLTYINVGTAVGSPVIFMEPQIGFFFQRRAELKPSCPRSSTYLSSLYSVKHSIMSKTLFITRQDVFAHTQTSAKKKNQNVTESTHCSRFPFFVRHCSASLYCHENIRLWPLPHSLFHMAWREPHTG